VSVPCAAGSLQTDQQDYMRRRANEAQRHLSTAQQRRHFFVYHPDDLLPGRQRCHDLLAESFLPHVGQELLDHAVVDIRFEQRHAQVFQGRLEGLLVNVHGPPQGAEGAL